MLTKLITTGFLVFFSNWIQPLECSDNRASYNKPVSIQEKRQEDSTKTQMKLDLKEVTDNTAEYLSKEVLISGTLKNEGKNYFNDLRLYLSDEHDNKIPVLSWLPLSVPPLPDKSKAKRPAVLSDFLNKKVEVTGIIKENTRKKIKEKYVLTVKSAEIVK